MDPQNFEQHSLSRRAWMFKRQTDAIEDAKEQQRQAQREQFDQGNSMNRMMGVLTATHLMVQRAEKLSRMTVAEIDDNIRAHEGQRAARLKSVQAEEIEELEKDVDMQSRWLSRPRDEDDSMDEDDLAQLDGHDDDEVAEATIQLGGSRTDSFRSPSVRSPSSASEHNTTLTSPINALETPIAAGRGDSMKITLPDRSPLQRSFSMVDSNCGSTAHTPSVSFVTSHSRTRRARKRQSVALTTQGAQTNVFFAQNQHADERLQFVTNVWTDLQRRMAGVEEFIYSTTAPHLSDMQSLVVWVRRTHRELQREFGTSFSLPAMPDIISLEARDVKEKESDRELRFIRRVLQRNERSLMESEEGDANLKYYRTFASTATQCKKHTKGVACQTLVSNDGIHQLVRQQHLVLEELLAALQECTGHLWATDYYPNSETSFHTTSHLVDMLAHDLQAVKDALMSVRNTPLDGTHDTKTPQRSVGCGPASDLKTMSRKTETEAVLVRPWAQMRDSYAQVLPAVADAECNTDLLRKATMAHIKALNESDAAEASQDAGSAAKVGQLEARLKIANAELDKARQQNTAMALRMDKDRLAELHREEKRVLEESIGVEGKLRQAAEEQAGALKASLAALEAQVAQMEVASSEQQEASHKLERSLKKELEASARNVQELEDERAQGQQRRDSERGEMQRRVSMLEDKEALLQKLAEKSKDAKSARKTSNQAVMVQPDCEDAATMMPKKFFYEMHAQCSPAVEARGCDPIVLVQTQDSCCMTDITGAVEEAQPPPDAAVDATTGTDVTADEPAERVASVGVAVDAEVQVKGLCFCNGQRMQQVRKRYSVLSSAMLQQVEDSGSASAMALYSASGSQHDGGSAPMSPMMSTSELPVGQLSSGDNASAGGHEVLAPAAAVPASEGPAEDGAPRGATPTAADTCDPLHTTSGTPPSRPQSADLNSTHNATTNGPQFVDIEIADFGAQAGSATADLTQRFCQTYVPTATAATTTGQTYRDFTMQARPPVVLVEGRSTQVEPPALADATVQVSSAVAQRTRMTQTAAATTTRECSTQSVVTEVLPVSTLTSPVATSPTVVPDCGSTATQTLSEGDTMSDDEGVLFRWTRVAPTVAEGVQTSGRLLEQLKEDLERLRPEMYSVATQHIAEPVGLVWTQTDWSSLGQCSVEVQATSDLPPAVPPMNLQPPQQQMDSWTPNTADTTDTITSDGTPPRLARLGSDSDVQGPSSPEKFERLPTSDLERNIPSSFCEKRDNIHSSISNSASNTLGKLNLTMSNPAGLHAARRDVMLTEGTTMSDTYDRIGTTGGFSVHEMYPERAETNDSMAQRGGGAAASPGVLVTNPTPRQQGVLGRASSLPGSHLKPALSAKSPLKSRRKAPIKTPQPQLQDPSVLYKFDSEKTATAKSRYSADCFMKAGAKSTIKMNSLAFSDTSIHDAMGSTLRGPAPPVVRGFANSTVKPKHANEWQQRKPRFLEPLLPELDDASDGETGGGGGGGGDEDAESFFYSPSRV